MIVETARVYLLFLRKDIGPPSLLEEVATLVKDRGFSFFLRGQNTLECWGHERLVSHLVIMTVTRTSDQ